MPHYLSIGKIMAFNSLLHDIKKWWGEIIRFTGKVNNVFPVDPVNPVKI